MYATFMADGHDCSHIHYTTGIMWWLSFFIRVVEPLPVGDLDQQGRAGVVLVFAAEDEPAEEIGMCVPPWERCYVGDVNVGELDVWW